jgi:hypothetical protein
MFKKRDPHGWLKNLARISHFLGKIKAGFYKRNAQNDF